MSSIHSFKSLAFRVLLKPAPRTQSESNAIFKALTEFGSIHTFQISRNAPVVSTDIQDDGTPRSTTATLVFNGNTKKLDKLRDKKGPHRITVSANANIPSAEVRDPYNIRGFKSRKPELEPRTFECQITPVTREKDPSSILDELQKNEYSDTFAADRNSCFGEILARTDCPSGLIHGLLPKMKDEHRSWTLDFGRIEEEHNRDLAGKVGKVGQRGQDVYASRDVRFVHLDLRTAGNDQGEDLSTEQSKSVSVDDGDRQNVKFYDEFADLRDFSLMKMYREATGKDGIQRGSSPGNFRPFPR